MRTISTQNGYGTSSTAELDDFSRIRLGHIRDYEEIRYDRPDSWSGTAYEYIGVAVQGTDTMDNKWICIRCTWQDGQKVREQFQKDKAWTNRILGWS